MRKKHRFGGAFLCKFRLLIFRAALAMLIASCPDERSIVLEPAGVIQICGNDAGVLSAGHSNLIGFVRGIKIRLFAVAFRDFGFCGSCGICFRGLDGSIGRQHKNTIDSLKRNRPMDPFGIHGPAQRRSISRVLS